MKPKTYVVEIKVEQTFHFHTKQATAQAAIERALPLMQRGECGVRINKTSKISNVTLAPYER